MTVTIRDVARIAGVSTATVSYVVNNTGSVGRVTKRKVEETIRATNWRPNVNAQKLARSLLKREAGSRAEHFQSLTVVPQP